MNDDDLLIFAAKAAGMPPPVDEHGVWSAWVGSPENGHWWNPLTEGGDAFALAVKCDIAFGRHANTHWARWEYASKVFRENAEKGGVQDPLAAARRAIVRAAAEIGRKMPLAAGGKWLILCQTTA